MHCAICGYNFQAEEKYRLYNLGRDHVTGRLVEVALCSNCAGFVSAQRQRRGWDAAGKGR